MNTNGAVLLKLNGNDRLFVNSDEEDKTIIEFKPENGAILIAHIFTSGLISIDFTTQFGKNFKYSSLASEFKIPNLIIDATTGDLVADKLS